MNNKRIFEAVSVEEELPPVQNSFTRPIIVICTDTLSPTNDEQFKEAHFKSDYLDNSEPYFSFGNPNDQISTNDKVTHWLKEITTE